jgi:hypothetical protein
MVALHNFFLIITFFNIFFPLNELIAGHGEQQSSVVTTKINPLHKRLRVSSKKSRKDSQNKKPRNRGLAAITELENPSELSYTNSLPVEQRNKTISTFKSGDWVITPKFNTPDWNSMQNTEGPYVGTILQTAEVNVAIFSMYLGDGSCKRVMLNSNTLISFKQQMEKMRTLISPLLLGKQ